MYNKSWIVLCLGLTFVVLTERITEIETDNLLFRSCYSMSLCLL
jgi:hypothetical protein